MSAGRAVHREPDPGDPLLTDMQALGAGDFLGRLFVGGERGVTVPRLRAAVAQVRASS